MRIIYKNIDDTISILIPTEEALNMYSITQIADKDVPYGVEYWIVPESNIPADRTGRDTWKIEDFDLGNSTGVGNQSNNFEKIV